MMQCDAATLPAGNTEFVGSTRLDSASPRENHGATLMAERTSRFSATGTQSTAQSHESFALDHNHSPDMGHPTPTQSHSQKPQHSSLEIYLPSDKVFVKGVGSMAEPALLSGNVVLVLSEPTSIKEITLNLRGKARLPSIAGSDSSSQLMQSNYTSSVVYSHDWTFLAGEKRSAHRLKAGRHVFPFQVELDATIPSTLTAQNSALKVTYKLRATAVRSGFSNNFHAQRQVYVLRSLALDALEYQQTLEIENTWPGKIMYSISLPHKAWAAGDTVCALVKFSPLQKGTGIKCIVTTINETTKVHYKFATVEKARTVASIKHAFVDGKPQVVDTYAVKPSAKSQGGMFHVAEEVRGVPGSYSGTQTPATGDTTPEALSRATSRVDSFQDLAAALPSASSSSSVSDSSSGLVESPTNESTVGENDIIALLPVTLPSTAPATHSADPAEINYRIRWVVSVVNPDGHTSELRCSLPLMILDHTLLTDARLATNETRRLCFGLATPDSAAVEDIDLPSYDNHVLDRIANSYFPSNARRVNNVWVQPGQGMNSMLYDEPPQIIGGGFGSSPSTPPEESDQRELDWADNELMLSLGDSWRSRRARNGCHSRSQLSLPQSELESQSRRSSRPSSRASSPERNYNYTHSSTTSSTTSHSHSHQRSIFGISLKPFTSLSSNSRSNSTPSTPPPPAAQPVQPVPLRTGPDHEAVLMSAFTEVPDYGVASRGFLGGGIPPLESVRGLPSYEEAARHQRDAQAVTSGSS